LALVEFLVMAVCAYLAVVLTQPLIFQDLAQRGSLIEFALIFASAMQLSTLAMGVYEAGTGESFSAMAVRSVVSYCLLGVLLMVVLAYFITPVNVMRGSLFAAVILSLVAVLSVRRIFYSIVDQVQLRRRVLILGAGPKAVAILERVSKESSVGFDVVGCIPSSPNNILVPESMVMDSAKGLDYLIRAHGVNEIVVALDDRRRDGGGYYPLDELLDVKLKGIRVTPVVEFYERELGRIELNEIHPSWMVYGDGFRYSQRRDIAKRIFDIAISFTLLFFAWPFMLLTLAAVYLETGRPIIYKQVRVGLNGREFEIYKFRSMTQNAEKDGQAVWAQKNDARVTRVGAFIRNTRLDELPQIFNVLRGDMSFVGPRPERPTFVGELIEELPYYDARHRVKPGLMGWAQLKYPYGASVEDAANKLVYDLYYVKNHSILLDFMIVVQSVEVILLGKGVR
jgi:sugar transferase (PEP-CTERM system associated)